MNMQHNIFFFLEAYNYTQNTLIFESKKIKPWFNPIFFGVLSRGFTKTLLNMLQSNISSIFLNLLFIFLMAKEYSNLKKEH